MDAFIAQTAADYDMSYHQVESIFKKCADTLKFYEQLEDFIKQRK